MWNKTQQVILIYAALPLLCVPNFICLPLSMQEGGEFVALLHAILQYCMPWQQKHIYSIHNVIGIYTCTHCTSTPTTVFFSERNILHAMPKSYTRTLASWMADRWISMVYALDRLFSFFSIHCTHKKLGRFWSFKTRWEGVHDCPSRFRIKIIYNSQSRPN